MWILELIGGGSDKPQWSVLRHNGPMFPSEYVPHKTPVIINNKEVVLPSEAEEFATMFARYIDTPYMESSIFKKNFWKDFKPTLSGLNINSLEEIDFKPLKNYLEKQKEIKSLLSKEQKEDLKKAQEEQDEPFKNCIIDGVQQKISNFKIEPPGIFIGRGSHPKIGRIKKRVRPENVILNLDKEAKMPTPNVPGKWGAVIHERAVIWLATWKEEITGKNKYIFTSLDSFFKSKSDESKFDLAKQLKKKINSIREEYEKQLSNEDMKKRQLATALYFIDNLALRVGGKKDTKDEADTVGVTSLRLEHLTLMDNNTIKLDFLGKDSVRYCRKVNVITHVYDNLVEFSKNKSRKDDLFELINSGMLNDYLDSFMEGLTAKVWRTFNASYLFQKEIDKIKEEKISLIDPNQRLNFLISMFNQANTTVALLCNHQKNVSGNITEALDKISHQIKELKKKKDKATDKDKINSLNDKIKLCKLKKDTKEKMKNVSLSTSKNNYIDPRIIFSFIKRFDIPPEKLFTQQLIDRFKWASNVDKDYKF